MKEALIAIALAIGVIAIAVALQKAVARAEEAAAAQAEAAYQAKLAIDRERAARFAKIPERYRGAALTLMDSETASRMWEEGTLVACLNGANGELAPPPPSRSRGPAGWAREHGRFGSHPDHDDYSADGQP